MVQNFSLALVGMGVSVAEQCGEKVSCKAGCGACCRQLVPITETEARNIADVVDAMPEPRRTTIRERFTETKRKLAEAGLLEKLEQPEENTRNTELGMDYFRAGIPCPFLEDESCSIHPDRPISCREYLVTSRPEHCANPTPDTIRRVATPGFVMTSFAKLDGAVKVGVRWVPLALALEFAAAHPEPPPTVPGPKLFETFMNALLNGVKVPPPGDFTAEGAS
jgi:Fe-S-cluster containining protein